MEIKKVVVIGSGTMGSGIAAQLCNANVPVTLLDLTGVAKYIISTTFKPIEVFIVAGSIYLFMTFIIHNLIKYLEKKYSY